MFPLLFRRAFVLLVFLLVGVTTQAQDTIRFVIGNTPIFPRDTEVVVPVFIYYSGEIELGALQTEITWESEGLQFDTLLNGPIISDDLTVSSIVLDERHLRIVMLPTFGFFPGFVGLDTDNNSLAFYLKFKVDKGYSGFSGLDFTPGLDTKFSDVEQNSVPVTTTPGSIAPANNFARLRFSASRSNTADNRVCIDLLAENLPALTGFDFSLSWDAEQFSLDETLRHENPLLLQESEVETGDGWIAFSGLSPDRDTTEEIRIDTVFDTRLMELCFLGNDATSYSQIKLERSPIPVFNGFYQDTRIDSIPVIAGGGELRIDTSTVSIFNPASTAINVAAYPNPTSGEVTIKELPTGKSFTASLFDVTGKLVRRDENVTGPTFDFPEIASGLYFLQLQDGQQRWVTRIVIN